MHAHDRTLIARMGFDDPDKKDRRHDLACQYLVANAHRLICRVLGPENVGDRIWTTIEMTISKGSGQYRTTIGFIDLVIGYDRLSVDDGKTYRMTSACCVEVKVNPVPVGDIIRQVRLYRDYRDSKHEAWIVATTFAMQESDVLTLKQSKIHHVLLGEGFEKWVAEQDAKSGDHDLSIEL